MSKLFYPQKIKIEEKPPHGNCTELDQSVNRNVNFFTQFSDYSQTACSNSYYQALSIYMYGKCQPSIAPCNPLNLTTAFGIPLNKTLNLTESEGSADFAKELLKAEQMCPLPCREIIFHVSKTSVLMVTGENSSR